MRKDLMLLAALAGLTVTPTIQADPGGTASSLVAEERPTFESPNAEQSGQVNDRNSARKISSPPVGGTLNPAAENLRRETPGSLGARGTIGQDGTGFTGQERIGTLPPSPAGLPDKDLGRHKDSATPVVRPEPFRPDAIGAPAANQTGRASQADRNSSAVEVHPTQPVGTAGDTLRPTPPNAPAPNAVGPGKSSNTSEDALMGQRIRAQLQGPEARTVTKLGAQDVANVQISAATGVVTLSGTVPTERAKQDVEAAVVHMRGVTSVDNHLTIKGADARTDNSAPPGK